MNRVIPKNMKTVRLNRDNGELTVGERPIPIPGPGEVLIRIAAAPVNPSDIAFVRGAHGDQGGYPVTPGFEGSGTVVAAGRGILPRLWLGKRVACAVGSGGTWAEYLLTQAKLCVPLPHDLTLDQGSMMIVNPLTALAFFDIVREERHTAIVNTAAASAVGRMIERLGRRNGVPVINIVRRQEQVELLRSLGVEHVLLSSDTGFRAELGELMNRLNATLILDAVGGELARQLYETAVPGTTLLFYGNLSKEGMLLNPAPLWQKKIRIEGFFLKNWLAKRGILHVLKDIRKVQRLGVTDFRTSVRARIPFSEARCAIEMYEGNRSAGKVLLVPDGEYKRER